HGKPKNGIEPVSPGMMRDDTRNQQSQDDKREEPAPGRSQGEFGWQGHIERANSENCNDCRPARFWDIILNIFHTAQHVQAVLFHDSNNAPDTITWPTIGLDPLSDLRARLLVQSGCELHLLECYPAKRTIGIAKGFWQFEVIVSLGDDQLYRLLGSLDGR